MTGKTLRKRKGFTLIELLVVVAIIALLISILLPSLRDAKEQAKIAKCLSNLRGLMTATVLYFQDYNDAFPFMVKASGGSLGICTWSYGGKTSDDYWKTEAGGVFFLRITERPMNEYLMGGAVEDDLRNGEVILKRTEVPALQCPSDKFSHQQSWDMNTDVEISSYDDIGTSYHYNLHAISDTNVDPWENSGAGWIMLGRKLVHDTLGGQVATLTFFHEDPMDFSFKEMTQEMGWHGKFSKHTAGFLDGHADYKMFDTRGNCGVGWASINQNWVRRIGQRKPPIYYTSPTKNCDPPK